jgi:hypothetical protein
LFKDYKNETDNISESEIKEFCDKINPKNPIQILDIFTHSNILFENYYEYINFISKKIKPEINNMFLLGDVVDNELIYCLTCIEDNLTLHLTFGIPIPANPKFDIAYYPLSELDYQVKELCAIFRKNYRKKYEFEYHYYEREKNVAKK